MKIGIFSNYEFNYETMEVTGSGVYRYQLDMSKKRGETTDRDLFRLMSDLKDFLQLKNNWNRGRDKSRIKTAYMEGRKMPYYTNLYDDQVINEWIESI